MARASGRWPAKAALRVLRAHGGPAPSAAPTDPWSQVLWENVAYLADDTRRLDAFRALKRSVGTSPAAIAAAPQRALTSVSKRGILASANAQKIRECAQIMIEEFGGRPGALAALPPEELRKALRRFPRIGAPAADRILLVSGKARVLSLDSNGLRVALRLGFGVEDDTYAKAYAAAVAALELELTGAGALIEAHDLLRRHGKQVCKRTSPRCGECPLAPRCPSAFKA